VGYVLGGVDFGGVNFEGAKKGRKRGVFGGKMGVEFGCDVW